MNTHTIIKESDGEVVVSRNTKAYTEEEVAKEATRLGVPCKANTVKDKDFKAGGKWKDEKYTKPPELASAEPLDVSELRGLDPNKETGTVKTILKYLQKRL